MEFQEALEKAEKNEELGERLERGYYLSSAVCITSDGERTDAWTLIYSLPRSFDVLNVFVSGEVKVREGVQNPSASRTRLEVSEVRTSSSKILEEARRIARGYKRRITKEIISIHQEESPVWRVACFTASLDVIILEFDASTGEKILERLDSMLKTV